MIDISIATQGYAIAVRINHNVYGAERFLENKLSDIFSAELEC